MFLVSIFFCSTLCHSKLHNQNYTHFPTQRGVRPLRYLTYSHQVPIIWDYVKCFPCNGHSPFAPPLSSRQCSYNLHGQSSNCKPSNPRHPSIGCRKMVQKVSGFAKFLQPLHGQAVQSLSSPRTAVFQAEENCFLHSRILNTHHQYF